MQALSLFNASLTFGATQNVIFKTIQYSEETLGGD